MTEGLGVAVVGAGMWGANHVRVWDELGALRVVCDASSDRVAAVTAGMDGVDTSTDLSESLARDDIQGVVIATPAVTHAKVAMEAIRAGKDVFVEKPLATDVADAVALVDDAEAAGRILMVGHVLEYHPVFLELRRLIHDGALGRVRYAYSHRLNFGRVRTEENALWSFAPHDIAMLLRLTDEEPSDVACTGGSYLNVDVADTTIMQLGFSGGVRAHIYVSWLHPFKEHRFVVIGDRQMAVFDDTAPWSDKLVLFPHEVAWVDGKVPVARRAEGVPVPVVAGEPLMQECRAFLEAMATRQPPVTDGRSGLSVLKVLEAGERSMAAGGAPVSAESVTP